MNQHFLAVCLWVIAALLSCVGAMEISGAVKTRKTAAAVRVLLTVAAVAAVLANAAADLW